MKKFFRAQFFSVAAKVNMATYERVDQELEEARARLAEAEKALKEFKKDEDGGKWLKELRTKLRRQEGFDESEKRAWDDLTAKEERLEAEATKCRDQVRELQRALTAATTAQPGNDFVSRDLVNSANGWAR
jgi:chromosome segregation ATPase